MFWVNPYSQRNQRARLWPVRDFAATKREADARERAAFEAECKAFEQKLAAVRRDLAALKVELAMRRLGLKYEGQPRDEGGRYTFGRRDGDAEKVGESRIGATDISAQRRIGRRPVGTPAQHLRLDLADAQARDAIARTRQLDPSFQPRSATSFDTRDNIEIMIRAKESERREADERYVALSRAGYGDSFPRQDAQATADVLRADAAREPLAGEGRNSRGVSFTRFEELRLELLGGAQRLGPDPRYDGVIYRRQDGSEIGLRISAEHGLTIDVLRSNDPLVRNGFRIHQR